MSSAPHESLEIELKFDVDAGLPAPDLADLVPDGSVGEPAAHHLEATYFDTAATALAANRITLRRRTGGPDSGWHLMRPSGAPSARRELTVGFDDAPPDEGVPPHLRDQVSAIIRGGELIPVATITTDRTVTAVFDADGLRVAEFCQDIVSAESLLGGGGVTRWAEWEFELVDGGTALLNHARTVLRRAGARRPSSASKLARAIGSQPLQSQARDLPAQPTALDLVRYELAAHRDSLLAHDPPARVDAPDAVHQLRVSARKIRSILTAYPHVLDPETVKPVSAELRLLGKLLGEARDLEVQLETNELLLAREDAPADLVRALIDGERARREDALTSMRRALSSRRYATLLDDLDALIDHPLPGVDADRPAREVAAEAVGASYERLTGAQRALRRYASWSTEWVEQLHTIRKRAKSLRYTVESAEPLRRASFDKAGKIARKVQSQLGTFQDTVVHRDRLAQIAERGSLSGDAMFTLGRIDAREETRGRKAVKAYRKL